MILSDPGQVGLKQSGESWLDFRRNISYRGGLQNILLGIDPHPQSKVATVNPSGEVREHAVGLALTLTQSALVVRLHLCTTEQIE